ncbi:L,D-transpeptidase family protein [Tepidiphilus sp. J10]|uniref:L,D-transpeptidase family protein n=1 Tax=Tepidiphilus sp. J10 TaxID=2502185 RepID=UPI00351A75BE
MVALDAQRLWCVDDGVVLASYPVSTAARGAGQRRGSLQTPLGWHRIRAKIGAGAPLGAVFVGRRPTGEIWTPELAAAHPDRDWILTRILWLCGEERGFNRLGEVDTMRRYIYIHGAPDTVPMGVPGSHGCIRMRNADVAEIFERVPVGTKVRIVARAQEVEGVVSARFLLEKRGWHKPSVSE